MSTLFDAEVPAAIVAAGPRPETPAITVTVHGLPGGAP